MRIGNSRGLVRQPVNVIAIRVDSQETLPHIVVAPPSPPLNSMEPTDPLSEAIEALENAGQTLMPRAEYSRIQVALHYLYSLRPPLDPVADEEGCSRSENCDCMKPQRAEPLKYNEVSHICRCHEIREHDLVEKCETCDGAKKAEPRDYYSREESSALERLVYALKSKVEALERAERE